MAQGTLFFFPHSNDTTTPRFADLDEYMNSIKSLPESYHPIVVCIMYSDVEKNLHKELRRYGLPLVTAGTMVSQKFVDRFYSLLQSFKYATSPNIGSHTFYSLEAGVPFFLFGPHPEYHIKSTDSIRAAVPDGKQNLADYGDNDDLNDYLAMKRLLSSPTDEVTAEQYALAEKYLGMDSTVSRAKACYILWRELFLHLDVLIVMLARKVPRLLIKIREKLHFHLKY